MKVGLARLLSCCALWALGACSDTATDVELRLYPCMLKGGVPTSVTLEIRSIDAMGAEIGEPLTKTFPIAGAGVFEDDYATVGFRPPAGAVTADIKVTWAVGDESVVAIYIEPVPALGQSLSLMTERCENGSGTTGTGTTDDTSSGSGTDTTTGTGTDTGTTTGTTDSTTGTSTGTGTGTTTDATTDSTTSTSTSTTDTTTDSTTGTTGDGPMEGDDCFMDAAFYCTGGPGALGTVLFCTMGKWTEMLAICTVDACMGLGFNNPQIVGCLGEGAEWSCACAETPEEPCQGMQSECGGMVGDGVLVQVCTADAHVAAVCPACQTVNGQPLCTL